MLMKPEFVIIKIRLKFGTMSSKYDVINVIFVQAYTYTHIYIYAFIRMSNCDHIKFVNIHFKFLSRTY